jgi:hypothetical protein
MVKLFSTFLQIIDNQSNIDLRKLHLSSTMHDAKKELEIIFLFTYNKLMEGLRMEFLENVKFYNSFHKDTIPINEAKEFFFERIGKQVNTQVVRVPIIQRFQLTNNKKIDFKNQIAFHTIKLYVEDHPSATLEDLRRIFERKDLGLRRVFKEPHEIQEWEKQKPRRYFHEEDELLSIGENKVAVTTQWGANFSNFVHLVKDLGYLIVPSHNTEAKK